MRVTTLRLSFSPHPLALLAVGFAAGILLAQRFSIPLFALMICDAAAWLFALWRLLRQRAGPASAPVMLALLLATLVSGASLETIEKTSTRSDQVKSLLAAGTIAVGDPVEITGALER